MANRRMFNKAITGSARFLKMPVDSQSLYFHLGMAADDDGVVEAWSVLRSTGSAEDNLRVLVTKGLIKILNEDLVSYIMDWNEHNEIRADRLTPSQYRELLVQVIPEIQLINPTNRADRPPRLLGRPGDNHGTEEVRLGKDSVGYLGEAPLRIEKDIPKKEEKTSTSKYPNKEEVFALWGNYPRNWVVNKSQCQAAQNLFEEKGIDKVQGALRFYERHKEDEFCPDINSPYDLDTKWRKLVTFKDKRT